MLSVIVRTQNGENLLLDVLRPLVGAAAEGVVRDVVFLDFGSSDGTAAIADAAGATMLRANSAGQDLTQAALNAAHRANWVLLLDQSTVLGAGWLRETISFVERQERVSSSRHQLSAVFRPEHEPESGSADLRRRMAVLLANRLLATAKLSQGTLIRRADLQGGCGQFDWHKDDPAIKVRNLLRLRSRSHMAQPVERNAPAEEQNPSAAALSRAAL